MKSHTTATWHTVSLNLSKTEANSLSVCHGAGKNCPHTRNVSDADMDAGSEFILITFDPRKGKI